MAHDQHGDLGAQIVETVSCNGDGRESLISQLVHEFVAYALLLFLSILCAELIQYVQHMLFRVDAVRAVRHRNDVAHSAVILIPDLADQFLQDILVRHDSKRSAVVVCDHSQIDLVPGHNGQKIIDLGRLMDKERLIQERLDVQRLADPDVIADILADMQNADDIVNTALVYRQAAVVLLFDKLQDLLLGHVDIDRGHVHAAGQNTLHRHVAELQRRGDQFALLLVDGALFGHILDDIVNIIFRDGRLVISLGRLCCDVADQGQQSSGGF